MAERAVLEAVMRELHHRGAWAIKTHGTAAGRRGVPDVVAVYHGHAIVVETKASRGRVARLQHFELTRAERAGAIALIARDAAVVRDALDAIDREEAAAA